MRLNGRGDMYASVTARTRSTVFSSRLRLQKELVHADPVSAVPKLPDVRGVVAFTHRSEVVLVHEVGIVDVSDLAGRSGQVDDVRGGHVALRDGSGRRGPVECEGEGWVAGWE